MPNCEEKRYHQIPQLPCIWTLSYLETHFNPLWQQFGTICPPFPESASFEKFMLKKGMAKFSIQIETTLIPISNPDPENPGLGSRFGIVLLHFGFPD